MTICSKLFMYFLQSGHGFGAEWSDAELLALRWSEQTCIHCTDLVATFTNFEQRKKESPLTFVLNNNDGTYNECQDKKLC